MARVKVKFSQARNFRLEVSGKKLKLEFRYNQVQPGTKPFLNQGTQVETDGQRWTKMDEGGFRSRWMKVVESDRYISDDIQIWIVESYQFLVTYC